MEGVARAMPEVVAAARVQQGLAVQQEHHLGQAELVLVPVRQEIVPVEVGACQIISTRGLEVPDRAMD